MVLICMSHGDSLDNFSRTRVLFPSVTASLSLSTDALSTHHLRVIDQKLGKTLTTASY